MGHHTEPRGQPRVPPVYFSVKLSTNTARRGVRTTFAVSAWARNAVTAPTGKMNNLNVDAWECPNRLEFHPSLSHI